MCNYSRARNLGYIIDAVYRKRKTERSGFIWSERCVQSGKMDLEITPKNVDKRSVQSAFMLWYLSLVPGLSYKIQIFAYAFRGSVSFFHNCNFNVKCDLWYCKYFVAFSITSSLVSLFFYWVCRHTSGAYSISTGIYYAIAAVGIGYMLQNIEKYKPIIKNPKQKKCTGLK